MERTWIFVIACAMLAGCAAPPERMALPLSCRNPGPPCNVTILPPSNPGICPDTVNFDPVHFARNNPNIPITWTTPAGYGFCPQLGDGVFLKGSDPRNQFDTVGADDPHGGGPCNRTKYTLLARNSVSGLEFPYKIIFHDRFGDRKCLIDPRMIND